METDKLELKDLIEKHVGIAIDDFRKQFVENNAWKDATEETAFAGVGNIEEFIANHMRSSAQAILTEIRKELKSLGDILER